jgi:hypothetical protein
MAQLSFTPEVTEIPRVDRRRHASRKRHGVHYTPSDLAGFVARRVLAHLGGTEPVILDPACGDGELLLAVAVEAAQRDLPAPHLVGIDRDEDAVTIARDRLQEVPSANLTLRSGDFLAAGTHEVSSMPDAYDAVISNPPYVRTQVLGAERAQALARQFALTGRVDLYHAFVAAMTARLKQGGVLGLLCSNRFLTTKGGQSLRSLLLGNYELRELWDLGDSKLFEAAVLPAVLVAQRRDRASGAAAAFVRVYEDPGIPEDPVRALSLLGALESDVEGSVKVDGRHFNIERGDMVERTSARPWRLTSASGAQWLERVRRHSASRLGDLGPIRVGIKTTADSVFIRASWEDLPVELRPEDELLHPLLTYRVAERWRAREDGSGTRVVLYPHEMHEGRRRTVDLSRFPRAAAYLEQHRARLEGREYVLKAGRAWYEIWVPQQPSAWAGPKIVWPDIAERPRFYLDTSGSLVNGDCYWLPCAGRDGDEVALALAVANSSFAVRFYDMCAGNRLYAGRRRFITQYLQDLPLPEASSAELQSVAELVSTLRALDVPAEAPARAAAEATLDAAVAELFGAKEVAG